MKKLYFKCLIVFFILNINAVSHAEIQYGTWGGWNFPISTLIDNKKKNLLDDQKFGSGGISTGAIVLFGNKKLSVGPEIAYIPVYELGQSGDMMDFRAYMPIFLLLKFSSKKGLYGGIGTGYCNRIKDTWLRQMKGGAFGTELFLGYNHMITQRFFLGPALKIITIFDEKVVYNFIPVFSISYMY